MSDSKLTERFSTPNSSKLAQILLDLRGVDGAQPGLCNLQPSDVTLWPEVFGGQQHPLDEDKVSTTTVAVQDTCNCRKSRCLKLYCQCFAARATCSSTCRCVSCENRPDNAAVREVAVNLILERNPNAFDSKYRPTSAAMTNNFTAITSIAHKNGCRCRKSMCLKKYCECFQGGVPCSAICTCLTCQNTAPHTSVMSNYQPIPFTEHSDDAAEHPSILTLTSQANSSSSSSSSSCISAKFGVVSEEGAGPVQSTSLPSNSRPPLVPSTKRKREALPSEGISGRDWGGSGRGVGSETEAPAASSVADSSISSSGQSPAPQLPAAQSLTRVQQQQLLEQLLFQELESQGLLTSPFASFVNMNCPGLLQGQGGSGPSDIYSLFNSQSTSMTQPEALEAASAASSDTPIHSKPIPQQKQESLHRGQGLLAASPNSMNIATALALLAANAQAQAQARAIGHLPYSVPSSSASGGVAGLTSALVTPRDKFSLNSLGGGAGCADINALHCFNGSSPMITHHSTADQDCTDEETTGTRTGCRSELTRSDSITKVSDECPERKDLFGAQEEANDSNIAAESTKTNAMIKKEKLVSTWSSDGDQQQLGLSDGVMKENSSPNLNGLQQVRGLSLLR